jgi:hypothetical protein
VDNTGLRPDAFEVHLPQLFKAEIWQDKGLMRVKTELNATKNKMDDMRIECDFSIFSPKLGTSLC